MNKPAQKTEMSKEEQEVFEFKFNPLTESELNLIQQIGNEVPYNTLIKFIPSLSKLFQNYQFQLEIKNKIESGEIQIYSNGNNS